MNLYDDIETDEEERPKRRPQRKKKKRSSIPLILVTLIAITAIAAVVLLVMQTMKLTDERDALARELSVEHYSAEEMQTAVSEAREESAAKAREDILLYFEDQMSSGARGPLDTLRSLLPDTIILFFRDRYIFQPIDASLARNTFDEDDFLLDEEHPRLTYAGGDDTVRTHFGIDVSAFQGEIDWEQVAADGVEFVFIRAGFRGWGITGSYNTDQYFEANITGAHEAGLRVGVYWVTHAISEEEVREESAYFLEIIEPYREMITLPVVWDLEQPEGEDNRIYTMTKEELTSFTLTFSDLMKEAGYQPMLYANLTSMVTMIDPASVADLPLWFAWYGVPLYYPYTFDIWQYGTDGRIAGINGQVDVNLMISEDLW